VSIRPPPRKINLERREVKEMEKRRKRRK